MAPQKTHGIIGGMSSVDKTIERLKNEFEGLCVQNKINSETRMLFKSMLMLINLLISIFLEKKTKKTSKNSGKPPSQTEKDDSALSPKGSKSKGKNEKYTEFNNARVKETFTINSVHLCNECGQDLSKEPCQGHERRY